MNDNYEDIFPKPFNNQEDLTLSQS